MRVELIKLINGNIIRSGRLVRVDTSGLWAAEKVNQVNIGPDELDLISPEDVQQLWSEDLMRYADLLGQSKVKITQGQFAASLKRWIHLSDVSVGIDDNTSSIPSDRYKRIGIIHNLSKQTKDRFSDYQLEVWEKLVTKLSAADSAQVCEEFLSEFGTLTSGNQDFVLPLMGVIAASIDSLDENGLAAISQKVYEFAEKWVLSKDNFANEDKEFHDKSHHPVFLMYGLIENRLLDLAYKHLLSDPAYSEHDVREFMKRSIAVVGDIHDPMDGMIRHISMVTENFDQS